ncbi:SDR family NAD(P)-dependent oxidoreductase [Enemella sp. A6]|uniref:SDR family NAD(P)-dependent oxidoreductase n=1 Tax=Enemella sp. A6 TaxID=3440152 RepID=UPI003EBADB00
MGRFENKNVVLTGAASGIGRATALRFAAEGAKVFAIDRNAEGLAETVAGAEGDAIITHVADLSDEQALVDAAAAAVQEFGTVDVLANVAGFLRVTPLDTVTSADYEDMWRVNFLAPALMCRELVPALPDNTGVIVNVCSVSATKAHPYMTSYAASKGALLAYSLSLAAELGGRRIRVVPVSPGGVITPLTQSSEGLAGLDTSHYARTFPLWGEMGTPEEIAAGITFAASPEASYLNGFEVRLDGGSHV